MRTAAYAGVALAVVLGMSPAIAQNVKITPLGSHPGELCANDRATIFEDPTGVRILYDAGADRHRRRRSAAGHVHVVLLSHAHGDHIGDQKLKAPGAGTCANSRRCPAGAEFHDRRGRRGEERGDRDDDATWARFVGKQSREHPAASRSRLCPQTGGVTTVPVAAPCRSNTHLGGTFIAKAANAAQGVEITIVYASHANNVPPALLSEAQRASSQADDGTSSCSARRPASSSSSPTA